MSKSNHDHDRDSDHANDNGEHERPGSKIAPAPAGGALTSLAALQTALAGVSAAEALHVDGPLLLPIESCVGKLCDHRFRLSDRNEALVGHLVIVAEADVAVLERQRIDGPPAVCLGDGALLPESPSAAAFALEQHHRQTGAADDRCRVDVGERRLERRQGGERTSRCWRGGKLAPGPFVFAVVVGVIAVAIMIVIVHGCLLPGRL